MFIAEALSLPAPLLLNTEGDGSFPEWLRDGEKLFAEKEASAPASPTGTPADAPPSPEISDDPPPSGSALDSLAAILPPLLQAFSGNGDLVKPEKLNLIRAFQPYLSSQRSPNIDRAIKMANIALAAKSAISVLGR